MKGLEIGNNGEFMQIIFNFNFWERVRIAKQIIKTGKIQFKIKGDPYEEINLK